MKLHRFFLFSCCITTFILTQSTSSAQEANSTQEACSGGVTLEESSGTLNIPGNNASGTSLYLHCSWDITVAPDKAIEISFTKFNLSTESCDCSKNLDVYDNEQSVYVNSISGSDVPKNFISESNQVRVVYNVWHNGNGDGNSDEGEVELTWQETDPEDNTPVVTDFNFEETLTASTGTIESPGYPNEYENDLDYKWIISANLDQYVVILPNSFDIEPSGNCRWDYLEISNGQESRKLCKYFYRGVAMLGQVTIHFHSDDSVVKNGFSLNYTLADPFTAACLSDGITLPTDSGSLDNSQIPNIPVSHCTWNIVVATGKVLEVTFNAFDMPCEKGQIHLSEDNQFHSWSNQINICGTTLPKTFRTTNNTLRVIYTEYSQYDSAFDITWMAVDALDNAEEVGDCSNAVSGLKGYITSPDYPNNYTNNLDSCWKIENPDNYTILLNVVTVNLESAFGCQFDYLIVYNSTTTKPQKLCGRYSEHSTYGTHIGANFHSDASVADAGFVLAYVMLDNNGSVADVTCGPMDMTEPSGFISSPGFPYPNNLDETCQWTITAPTNQVIEVRFERVFYLGYNTECADTGSYLELRDGNSEISKRVCSEQQVPALTTTNELGITYQVSDPSFLSSAGVLLHYQMKDKNADTGNCGGTLNINSTFANPNFPNSYPSHSDCTWTVDVPEGETIIVQLMWVNLEKSEDCSADVLTIAGSDGSNFQTICGENSLGPFSFTGTNVEIKFRSDFAVSGSGFYGFIGSGYPTTGNGTNGACFGGVRLEESSGTLSIPDSSVSDASSDVYCSWSIIAAPEKAINISFTKFHLPTHSNCNKYLYVFDNEVSVYDTGLSGTDLPKSFISKTNELRITYQFHSCGDNGDGAQVGNNSGEVDIELAWQETDPEDTTVDTFTLEETLTSATGVIESPGYPDNYINNVDYKWVISTGNDKYVVISASSFDIEWSGDCRWDYLEISNGQESRKMCKYFRGISMQEPVTIHFHSDDDVTRIGFSLNYTLTDETVAACSGEGVSIVANSGNLATPELPSIEMYARCTWHLKVDSGKAVQLTFNQFDIPCEAGQIYLSDEYSLQSQNYQDLCGTTLPKALLSTNNSLIVNYNKYFEQTVTFDITWMAVDPPDNTVEVECANVVSGTKGYITLPEYPNNYTNDVDMCWTIENPNNHFIKLELVSVNLEQSLGCQYDYLYLHDFTTTNSHKTCGMHSWHSTFGTQVGAVFHSDGSDVAGGFVLAYAMRDDSGSTIDAGCGPTDLTEATGFISSPGFPYDDTDIKTCQWIITAPTHQVIEVKFLRVNFQNYDDCSNSDLYLDLQDGNSEVSKRICFEEREPALTSTNELKVSYHISDEIFYHGGFILSYQMKDASTDIVSCGGNLSIGSNFTSPNYPLSYPSNADCTWNVIVPEGKNVTICIDWLQIEDSEGCSADVLEIGGLDGSNVHTFCGNAEKKILHFSESEIKIRFRADFAVSKAGFRGFVSNSSGDGNVTFGSTTEAPGTNSSTTIESAPTMTNTTAESTDGVPTVVNTTATSTDGVPTVVNTTATSTDGVPTVVNTTATSTDGVPTVVNTTATSTDGVPTVVNTTATSTDGVPTVVNTTAASTDGVPTVVNTTAETTSTVPTTPSTVSTTISTAATTASTVATTQTTGNDPATAFPGAGAVYIAIESGTERSVAPSRSYTIGITVDGTPILYDVGDVEYYLIVGLATDVTYFITLTIYEDNVFQSVFILTARTTKQCTRSCTNGACIVMDEVNTVCHCLNGYQHDETDSDVCIDIDECTTGSYSCPDNSKCSNLAGSYKCNCVDGFTKIGDVCEEYTACLDVPCENGGSCTTSGTQFICNCPNYYSGVRCEYYTDPCSYSPCKHGGACTDRQEDYDCECPPTYTGKNCTEDVDECATGSFACLESSECENKIGDYDCVCNDGYTGDGKVKCYQVVLLPYGEEEGDTMLEIGDDVASPSLNFSTGLPIGSKSFTSINILSNGFISLGPFYWYYYYMYAPWGHGFGYDSIPMIAPFWDDFHPSPDNEGRIYYQVYDGTYQTFAEQSQAAVDEVAQRINNFAGRTDFEPSIVVKATWSKVVMHYESDNRDYPSTFQAIIASDLTDTFVIFNYLEDGMLFDTSKRWYWSNQGLIGYTNGVELEYIEVQGDYRPDQRTQNGAESSGLKGQYFYQVASARTTSQIQAAQAACLRWYNQELKKVPLNTSEPCPATRLQALIDRRFIESVDTWLPWLSWYYYYDYYQDEQGHSPNRDVTEWAYDEAQPYSCYQMRVYSENMSTPRCCYGSREDVWSWWWGAWSWGPLLVGPFGSRYERHQIPIVEQEPTWNWIFERSVGSLDLQYNQSLESDLIPRRVCCIESESTTHCDYYKSLRPDATSDGYVQRWPTFFWGDPHITTSDGVLYSFNGLGEYHMVYAPGIFALQARTQKAVKDDGTPSDATVFVAFAAKDLSSSDSGTVQFEVDFSNTNGDGLIVKVDGEIVSDLSTNTTSVKQVSLTNKNGTYEATFPSSQFLSVSASTFLLSMQFTGETSTMQHISKGLLGFWDGNKENDFEMRDGTVVDWSSLQPTENLDILSGTLSEKKLYPFGQSWQVPESESIFTYSGGSDTYDQHNPSSAPEPPFLEDLVANQKGLASFNETVSDCTSNDVVSTTCLYDVLTTNRKDIGRSTLTNSDSASNIAASNSNTPPSITLNAAENVDDDGKTVHAKVDVLSTFTFIATDPENNNVTFALESNNSVPGMTIDPATGDVTWTPSSSEVITAKSKWTMTIIARDSVGAESVLTVNIKLCACANNGMCIYDQTLLGSENYEMVDCACTEAYSGTYCTEDRNGCELAACFANVTCTDVPAPGVGETCGDCPTGTTGNGRNCTNINQCESDPCEQNCEPLHNNYKCSCNDGYSLSEETMCIDVDECSTGNTCAEFSNTDCTNTVGNYSCDCSQGFEKSGPECIDIDECNTNAHNCPAENSECYNTPGSFACHCLSHFTRVDSTSDQSGCVDLNECENNLHGCNKETEDCVNQEPFYRCDCKNGFENSSGSCVDIKECSDPQLNDCDATTSLCTELEGSYTCSCKGGYEKVNGVCSDIDECLDNTKCPTGTTCFNRNGGYECRCAANVVCAINPTLEAVTVLSTSQTCLTLELDKYGLYGLYQVKLVSGSNTIIENTTSTTATVCGLSPNTEYNISSQVLQLKGSNLIYSTPHFNEHVTLSTARIEVAFSVRILNEVFTSELEDINSDVSVALRARHEDVLKSGLEVGIGSDTLPAVAVTLDAFASGSVIASGRAATEATTAPSTLSSVGLNSAIYSNVARVNAPPAPTNVQATTSSSSITLTYDAVANAVLYNVELNCGDSSKTTSVPERSATFDDPPSSTSCSLKVRALASETTGGNTFAYSDFSDVVLVFTAPNITQLSASNIQLNSVVISFASVLRAVRYTITANGISLTVQPSEAVDGLISKQVTGLSQGTTYNFQIVAVATDVNGNEISSSPATLDVNTAGTKDCQSTPSSCPVNSNCTNTDGTFSCVCNDGLEMNNAGNACLDINECLTTSSCPDKSECTNTFGNFNCTCNSGLFFNANNSSCLENCLIHTDYCSNGATCSSTLTEYPACQCTSAYQGTQCQETAGWVIALSVVAGVVVLVALLGLMYYAFRKRDAIYHGIG